jgi:two-component system NtrC family sensor kinase
MKKNVADILAKLTGVQSNRKSYYVELKETIDEMSKQNKRLEIINQIARSINVEMSYEEIIERVAEPLRQVMSYDLLSFCLLDKGELVIKSSIPKSQKILGVDTVLLEDNSAPWKAIQDKKYFLRLDIWHYKHCYQEDGQLKLIGIQSAIMAPLFVKGEVIGTLNFGSKNPYAYSNSDAVFVQQLADQLAVCLANSDLYYEVLRSKKIWESTFTAVQNLLFVIDKNYEIVSINRHKVGNEPVSSIIGAKCYELFNGGEKCDHCPAKEAFLKGNPTFAEIIKPSGKILHVSAFPVLSEQGDVTNVVCYVEDVTERMKLEAQLFQSAKLAAIGEMASGVAHELNSPLTAILGNALLLLRKMPTDQPQYKLLSDIKNCGTRCKRIIENLLTFSRQDKQRGKELVGINTAVENSLSLVKYQLQLANIKLTIKLHDELPKIRGNCQQLEQVIVNMLLNAKDALDGVEDKEIKIFTYRYNENFLALEISDKGSGIAPEYINQIYNPFFTTKEARKGTGLGLSVSLGIVESHGGSIKVESVVDQGSSFYILLPLESSEGEVE